VQHEDGRSLFGAARVNRPNQAGNAAYQANRRIVPSVRMAEWETSLRTRTECS